MLQVDGKGYNGGSTRVFVQLSKVNFAGHLNGRVGSALVQKQRQPSGASAMSHSCNTPAHPEVHGHVEEQPDASANGRCRVIRI